MLSETRFVVGCFWECDNENQTSVTGTSEHSLPRFRFVGRAFTLRKC